MANNLKLSTEAVNAGIPPVGTLLNNGYLRIYDGTQPATADTAISTQVLLAELRFNASAFGSPTAGVITAASITGEDSALDSGTASWFRALKSDGTSPVCDGSVGTATSDLILNSVAISSGATVNVTALTLTLPKNA